MDSLLLLKIKFFQWCFARLSKDISSHLLYRLLELNILYGSLKIKLNVSLRFFSTIISEFLKTPTY